MPVEINMDLAKTCQGAKIKTNQGLIEIKFYNEQAPTTVANFCTLSSEGFYDGIRFHRVIKDFMIQAGDPNSKDLTKKNSWGMGGPDYKFKDELPKAGEYKLGSLAMANSGPNTNGSQFFIISGEAGVGLPPLYTLFGEVITGMEIVDAIQNVETEGSDRPINDVIIEGIEVLEK
ncbi:MAG: peptidylprolyl isomerase [Candidatus Moranbacteria bacterium]|nr:peptidylprolyl isomerase [Candidatus Moranbacteria bacterium]